MEQLPVEILHNIILLLPRNNVGKMARLNKKMLSVVNDQRFWKRKYECDYGATTQKVYCYRQRYLDMLEHEKIYILVSAQYGEKSIRFSTTKLEHAVQRYLELDKIDLSEEFYIQEFTNNEKKNIRIIYRILENTVIRYTALIWPYYIYRKTLKQFQEHKETRASDGNIIFEHDHNFVFPLPIK